MNVLFFTPAVLFFFLDFGVCDPWTYFQTLSAILVCSVAGGERVPPAPLGWSCLSVIKQIFFSSLTCIIKFNFQDKFTNLVLEPGPIRVFLGVISIELSWTPVRFSNLFHSFVHCEPSLALKIQFHELERAEEILPHFVRRHTPIWGKNPLHVTSRGPHNVVLPHIRTDVPKENKNEV